MQEIDVKIMLCLKYNRDSVSYVSSTATNKYIIKSYVMSVAYDEAKSIMFYDKKGTLVPEERIPDL